MSVVVISACAVLTAGFPAHAQSLRAPGFVGDEVRTADTAGTGLVTGPAQRRSSDDRLPAAWTAPQARQKGGNAAGFGALIGAAAAAGLTVAAASKYGGNEGGSFCTRCAVQWSAITVPAGAGLGALIGWSIGRSRQSVATVPVFGPKAAGVLVSASF